jgi:hypothetical protein
MKKPPISVQCDMLKALYEKYILTSPAHENPIIVKHHSHNHTILDMIIAFKSEKGYTIHITRFTQSNFMSATLNCTQDLEKFIQNFLDKNDEDY